MSFMLTLSTSALLDSNRLDTSGALAIGDSMAGCIFRFTGSKVLRRDCGGIGRWIASDGTAICLSLLGVATGDGTLTGFSITD